MSPRGDRSWGWQVQVAWGEKGAASGGSELQAQRGMEPRKGLMKGEEPRAGSCCRGGSQGILGEVPEGCTQTA